MGRLGEMQEGGFKERNQSDDESGEQAKEGQHGVGLQKSCQELVADCMRRAIGVNLGSDGVSASTVSGSAGILSRKCKNQPKLAGFPMGTVPFCS